METINDEKNLVPSYSPSSLVNIFNNALTGEAARRLFRAKGVYNEGKGIGYSGYYYDTLKDEATDASITLIVPALLRGSIVPQQTIKL